MEHLGYDLSTCPSWFRLYRGNDKPPASHESTSLDKNPTTPPKMNSSPLKNGAWKMNFFLLGPGNFPGSYVKLRECTKNWNKETTQLATSTNLLPENCQPPTFVCLKRLCFFFPCADHFVALLPKKWCFSWPMEIHDALRAAMAKSQLGEIFASELGFFGEKACGKGFAFEVLRFN